MPLAICSSGGSRLPFARPQTLQTLPQASKATTLTATTCPCHLFFRGSRLPFARRQTPQTLPTLPQASKATTLTATCPCHLFFQGSNPPAGLQGNNSYSYYMPLPSVFQGVQDCRLPVLKPPNASNPPAGLQGNNSYSYMSLPSVFQGVQDCRLPALKPHKRFCRPPRQQPLTATWPLPSVFSGVQDCRLPALKPPKRFCRPPRQQLLQLHAPAICFSGGLRLPFARPQSPQTLPTLLQACKATTLTAKTLPQASKATTLTATCPCHLFFRGLKTAVCPPLKPPKRFRRPPRQQLLQLHAPAICFSGGSRLQFACPQSPQTLPTLPQASKATTLTATTCPCHLFFRGFKTAVCPPSNPQASKATTLTATCPCHLFFRGFKTAVCPPSNPPNASAGLQGNNSYYSYMPLPSVFQGVQDCRLPALKPPKRFRRPPRQQLLQLHASAICFSGGSRLPFARPQTFQTFPQASKATTLTATCPCHLFFRGFKTLPSSHWSVSCRS